MAHIGRDPWLIEAQSVADIGSDPWLIGAQSVAHIGSDPWLVAKPMGDRLGFERPSVNNTYDTPQKYSGRLFKVDLDRKGRWSRHTREPRPAV